MFCGNKHCAEIKERVFLTLKKKRNMTVEELIESLMSLPLEQWDMDVVFGSAYPGMDVETVKVVSGQIELSF